MNTVRVARRKKFTTIERGTVNDERLSFRARGVLVWLLDKPDDWQADSTSIAEHGTEGREAVRTALAELEACGYLVRNKLQGDRGRWYTEWVVHETPFAATELTDDGFPVVGEPVVGLPTVGQPNVGALGANQLPTVTETVTENPAEADAPAALFDAPKPKPKGKKPPKALEGLALVADELARAEWESRQIKPVCGFVPLRLRIGEALEAGHTREAVAAVLPSMSMFSRNSFDMALSRHRPGRPQRPVDDDRARPSGKVAL